MLFLRAPELVTRARGSDLVMESAGKKRFTLSSMFGVGRRRPAEDLVGLFSRCVAIRAESYATAVVGTLGTPGLRVVRPGTKQGAFDPVEAAHPWVILLDQPQGSTGRSGLEMWEWVSTVEDLWGYADLLVEDDARGVPVALWEVFPEFGRMEPIRDGRGGLGGWRFLRADNSKPVELKARDVIRFRAPHPESPYLAWSLLDKMGVEVDKAKMAAQFERDLLMNGMWPPIYASTTAQINETQAKKVGEKLREDYGGDWREVKGIPVLGHGAKLEKIPFSVDDLALVDSGQLTDKRIFWGTGVHQGMVDHTAIRANAFEGRQSFYMSTIQPLVNRRVAQLQRGFVRAFEPVAPLFLQAPNVVPVDPKQQLELWEGRIRMGLDLVDDIRATEGKDPHPNGQGKVVYGYFTWKPVAVSQAEIRKAQAEALEAEEMAQAGPDGSPDGDPDGLPGGAPGGDGQAGEPPVVEEEEDAQNRMAQNRMAQNRAGW